MKPKYTLLAKTLTGVMVLLIVILAVATFLERSEGSAYVGKHVYHTFWFCCCWGAVALLGIVALIRGAVWRRLPLLLVHGSLLIILGGAMITFLWGKQGIMHLRTGMQVDNYQVAETGEVFRLPFTLTLDTFLIENYPGTEAASDYVSRVTYQADGSSSSAIISMNNILQLKGYRLYQSSFDEDKRGSWLSVNYDPWGTGITYLGYALFGIGMLWTLFSRKEEFRRLLRHPLMRNTNLKVVGLLICCLANTHLQAENRTLPVLKRSQADSLASVQVIYHDRVVPFNTLARDFMQKVYGRASYHGFTAEQVVGGWLLSPEVWNREPIIKIKNTELRQRLGLQKQYASLSDLYDDGNYRLQPFWQEIGQDVQSQLGKGIMEVDEKVGLIMMLLNGTLIKPVSETHGVEPISPMRLKAELIYNKVPFTKILFMACLTLGFLSFFWLLYREMSRRDGGVCLRLFVLSLYLLLTFHLCSYLLRWYIGGRIPLSNGYETMQFLALCILVLAAVLRRHFPFTLTFGFLLAGFTLLVSYLGQMNPQITPLMPVLSSPLLSIHVSVIMIAYALLAFTMLNGVLALILLRKRENAPRVRQLTILSTLLLYPATAFLGAGIFLGAVWANVSWGSYWSWDPKEVWALITFLVYSAAFHRRSLPWLRRPAVFHAYLILAFLVVLMTYFGVNYVLGGMHSYAG